MIVSYQQWMIASYIDPAQLKTPKKYTLEGENKYTINIKFQYQ